MDAERFGRFIAEARKEKEMTQADLASVLNVTDKAVSRWERGIGFPDINTIEPLAEALGISVLELMRYEKNDKSSVSDRVASAALTDAFEIVKKQRQAEKRNIIKISVGAAIIVAVILLFDFMEPMGVVMVYLPVICFIGSIVLAVYGIYRRVNRLPCLRTFILAGLLMLIPIMLICTLLMATYIGGPVPN